MSYDIGIEDKERMKLNDAALLQKLQTAVDPAIDLIHLKTIDSTNKFAQQLSQHSERGPVIIWSDRQTAGVGRFSRPFYSPENGGIYLTLFLPDFQLQAADIGLLTTSLAVATLNVIESDFNISPTVKWVNDLYFNQRKIAGILVEAGQHDSIIVGIGVNLHQDQWPKELSAIAGNVLDHQPSLGEKSLFVLHLTTALYQASKTYTSGIFLAKYRRRLTLLNHRITVQLGHERISGIAADIDAKGRLILQDEATHSQRVIGAGEVLKVFMNPLGDEDSH